MIYKYIFKTFWLNWKSFINTQEINSVWRHVNMKVPCPDERRRKISAFAKAPNETLVGLILLENCNTLSQVQLICLKSEALLKHIV